MRSSQVFRLMCVAMSCALTGCLAEPPPGDAPECVADADCVFGQVCLASGECGAMPCASCGPDQICVTLEDGVQACSVPQCGSDADCVSPERCEAGVCAAKACSTAEDCDPWEICDPLQGVCREPPEVCEGDQQCSSGEVCITDLGVCVLGCADDDACGEGQVCDPSSRLCVTGCRDDSGCLDLEVCDQASRSCIPRCSDEGLCDEFCEVACDPVTPGSCSDATPFCIDGCCVECVGPSDCFGSEVCVESSCVRPPSCIEGSAMCPAGLSCQGGSCVERPPWVACDDERPCAEGLTCGGIYCLGCTDGMDLRCGPSSLCISGICYTF